MVQLPGGWEQLFSVHKVSSGRLHASPLKIKTLDHVQTSGELRVVSPLDRETVAEFELGVEVEDMAASSSRQLARSR